MSREQAALRKQLERLDRNISQLTRQRERILAQIERISEQTSPPGTVIDLATEKLRRAGRRGKALLLITVVWISSQVIRRPIVASAGTGAVALTTAAGITLALVLPFGETPTRPPITQPPPVTGSPSPPPSPSVPEEEPEEEAETPGPPSEPTAEDLGPVAAAAPPVPDTEPAGADSAPEPEPEGEPDGEPEQPPQEPEPPERDREPSNEPEEPTGTSAETCLLRLAVEDLARAEVLCV